MDITFEKNGDLPTPLDELSEMQLLIREAHLEHMSKALPYANEKAAARKALKACVQVIDVRGIKSPDIVIDPEYEAKAEKIFGPLRLRNREKSSR